MTHIAMFFSSRSNRMKSGGHRSASQERLMSTSWQGQPGYPQMAAEAEKRRLGATLVMPPPSQTNTLRRPAQPGPAAQPSQGAPPQAQPMPTAQPATRLTVYSRLRVFKTFLAPSCSALRRMASNKLEGPFDNIIILHGKFKLLLRHYVFTIYYKFSPINT